MTPELRLLTDDQLRERLVGYCYDEPHLEELFRRMPAIGTLHMALGAAMQGDQDAHEAANGFDMTSVDVPESPGTRAVRDLYKQALASWMDGTPQLITKHGAAAILGMEVPDSAARKLARWGVHPVGYTGGSRPEALFARAAVEEETRRRPRPRSTAAS